MALLMSAVKTDHNKLIMSATHLGLLPIGFSHDTINPKVSPSLKTTNEPSFIAVGLIQLSLKVLKGYICIFICKNICHSIKRL